MKMLAKCILCESTLLLWVDQPSTLASKTSIPGILALPSIWCDQYVHQQHQCRHQHCHHWNHEPGFSLGSIRTSLTAAINLLIIQLFPPKSCNMTFMLVTILTSRGCIEGGRLHNRRRSQESEPCKHDTPPRPKVLSSFADPCENFDCKHDTPPRPSSTLIIC